MVNVLYVGNSLGELYLVEGGRAKGLGTTAEVPWSDDGIHYGTAVVKEGKLYCPDGSIYGEFNLVLVPYGLSRGVYSPPRYALAVAGDELLVVDLVDWRVLERAECLGKWDYSPVYPFADVKSIYCTDGFVAVATPERYGLYAAPCGLSFHVDFLSPSTLIVRDVEHGGEEFLTVFKVFTTDGRYLKTIKLEVDSGSEPLAVSEAVAYYTPDGHVVWNKRRVKADQFFLSRYGVVVGNRVIGDRELALACNPDYVFLDKYICNGEVRKINIVN